MLEDADDDSSLSIFAICSNVVVSAASGGDVDEGQQSQGRTFVL